jgi:hypothetical protein
LLFLRRNKADPLVVLPWSTWQRILLNAKQTTETINENRPNRLIRDDLGLFSKRTGRRSGPMSGGFQT